MHLNSKLYEVKALRASLRDLLLELIDTIPEEELSIDMSAIVITGLPVDKDRTIYVHQKIVTSLDIVTIIGLLESAKHAITNYNFGQVIFKPEEN